MQKFRRGSKLTFRAALIVGALSAVTCGGTIAFQGQSAMSVVGTPPPPPPPPPPPEPPSRVVVKDDRIEITEKIQFGYNSPQILEQSFSLLDEIAATIQKESRIKKISIEGHASSEGDPDHNRKLSEQRAQAVMKYLVGKGIDQSRLVAKGWGADKPIADNSTEEGREKNRRVEFLILEQDFTQKKVEVSASGDEKVVEEKKVTGGGPEKKKVAPLKPATKPATPPAETK
jgi:outer membrane protein OmpA-like peptidoglycan-associated protein